MIQTLDDARVSVHSYALTMREIRQMPTARLHERLKYLDRQLGLWNQDTQGKPMWFQRAANQQRAALNGERRRIGKALQERADAEAFSNDGENDGGTKYDD